MQFKLSVPTPPKGMKIDWDADVEIADEIREALHPQDVERLRVGRLMRSATTSSTAGRRSGRTNGAAHPKGALVFASPDGGFCFVEVSDDQ